MLGVHVFEKLNDIEWEEQVLCVALLSALSWKRYHGKIHLYTNEAYLETLKKWKIDTVYDHIDTETLKEVDTVDKKTYWAFGKIHVASKIKEPFVLVDNDLWLEGYLDLDKSFDYIGYHYENFVESDESHYIDFDRFIPQKWIGRWDRNLLVTNTALLYIRNQDLIQKWYQTAKEIAELDLVKDVESVKKMIFVEQRLLPMLAHEMRLNYTTFLKPIYQSRPSFEIDGSEWDPHPSEWTDEYRGEFQKIRHIWGLKKLFSEYEDIRQLVFNNILMSFIPYESKISEFMPLLNNLKAKSII
jgi:hypothetical protein